MIELIYSNKTERLLDELAKDLRKRRDGGANPLDPVELVVPNRNMETWVRLNLAQKTGIAANLCFRRLERFFGDIVAAACPGEYRLVDLDIIEAAVLAALMDEKKLNEPDLQPVKRYLAGTQSVPINLLRPNAAFAEPAKAPAGQQTALAYDYHLAADGKDIRLVQLASRIAYLFQEYSFSRPEMIATWREGADNAFSRATGSRFKQTSLPYADPTADDSSLKSTVKWQRALWRAVFNKEDGILAGKDPGNGLNWTTLDLLALDTKIFEKISKKTLPPVHIFGISYMARLFQLLFGRLGEVLTLRIYTLNPCAEFWEDVETDRELFHRLEKEKGKFSRRIWSASGETGAEDPFGLTESDTPALKYWGKPGREHMRLLGELTDCDFRGAFSDPYEDGTSLLQALQRDILLREPERNLADGTAIINEETESPDRDSGSAKKCDQSIKLVAAPSVRREVEWVADEIWSLMREDSQKKELPPLRFSDIAIIVNSAGRDVYLPQIETVFAACQGLPSSVSDLPGASGSRLVEAMSMLLQLPFGRFTRAEMLDLFSHPAVIGRFNNISAADLAGITETLGIVFGADHFDHAGTYIDEDVFNWDQGIRRLALGSFMTGEKSGDTRIFETEQSRCLVEEVAGQSLAEAAHFGMLTRSFFADARFLREQMLTLTDWARFFSAQLDAYLYVENQTDARDRLRLLRALSKLENMDLGYRVSGRMAAEIAGRTLESLEGGRGQYLAEGVVVSSFLPMRAIPFRAVFLLGLGEGLFPATGRRDALDLRAAKRRAGDVDSSERDRYMFLETLLCSREKLYLSYIRRDEQTGDALQPSAVVQELLHMLKLGYTGEKGLEKITATPFLRRYDEPGAADNSFIDEARAEAQVQKIATARKDLPARANVTVPVPDISSDSGIDGILSGLRKALSPEALEKLSSILILPGKAPAPRSVTVTTGGIGLEMEDPVNAPVTLSLSAIRRFLECPMQGWAAAMLGLSDEEEDLADREEEDFEVGKPLETGLLREVFISSCFRDENMADTYRDKAARLRLAGKFPVGDLGRAVEKRHLGILKGWRSSINALQSDNRAAADTDAKDKSGAAISLQRIRFGRSSDQGAAEKVLDPLLLNIYLKGNNGKPLLTPVRITGLTEGLIDGGLISVTLQTGNIADKKDKISRGRSFRHLIRGLVDHLALAAVNSEEPAEREIAVLHPAEANKSTIVKLRLCPLDAGEARERLTTLITDLLQGHHAYLLPAEAAFLEYLERVKPAGQSKKKGNTTTKQAHLESQPQPDGDRLRLLVAEMAENERWSFSSSWGPVPAPRSYDAPPPDEAARIVSRRFGPLFKDILEMEGI